jgi:DNA-binding CsgD family transcriptional regulator/small-conductance mechanosensitive channel
VIHIGWLLLLVRTRITGSPQSKPASHLLALTTEQCTLYNYGWRDLRVIEWLVNNWAFVAFPFLAFVAVAVLGLWARLTLHRLYKQRRPGIEGTKTQAVIEALWNPFLYWFLFLGTYVAIRISILSPTVKSLVSQGLASLFVLSLMWIAISLTGRFVGFYLGKLKANQHLTLWTLNTVRTVIAIIGVLIILEIWGAPTEPIFIVIVAGVLIAGLALRDPINRFLAWLEISSGEHIRVGDTIKLASGEMGCITQISWTHTMLRTPEGNLVIIPNNKFVNTSMINYGAAVPGVTSNHVQRDFAGLKRTGLIDALSEREREILGLVGKGATNREIARSLVISEHTVKSHIRSILGKLNLRNRQQVAVYAEREGLLIDAGAMESDQQSI